MTSFKQIEANRRNARRSTGPTTEQGKLRSRRNAVRHGLTAETVIGALEDAEDYKAFEAAVISDYDAQSAVERELVLRLASLLWRIRRATIMETGLFEIQARQVLDFRRRRAAQQSLIRRLFPPADLNDGVESHSEHTLAIFGSNPDHCSRDLAHCFLRLANLPSYPLDRLSRYEAALWRQAGQTTFALHALHHRRPWDHASRSRPTHEKDWQPDMQEQLNKDRRCNENIVKPRTQPSTSPCTAPAAAPLVRHSRALIGGEPVDNVVCGKHRTDQPR